jgi:ankyrin repeat protein
LFDEASDEHKQVVLQYMVKAAGPPEAADNLLIPGTESDYQEKDRLLNLLWQNTRAENACSPKQKYQSNLYYQIAMCYFMGLGTKIDEVEALKYLAMAAKTFARRAMFMFTSVEASTNAAPIPHMPYQLLLSIAYLNDSTESVDLLKKSYPSLLAILKTIRFEKGLSLHRTICNETADIHGVASTGPPARSDDIFELINSEDVDALQQLLNDDPSLASERNYGLSTLHALSLISDEVAMQMATVLLTAGASLDTFSYESHQPFGKNRFGIGHGTPLTWAVTKQKPRLFASLVQWCIQHDTLPNVGRRSLGLLPLHYGQSEMARYLIEAQSKMVRSDAAYAKEFFWSTGSENIPDDHQGDFDFGAPQAEAAPHIQSLSWRDLHWYQSHAALEKNDGNTVLRRWLLGGNYRHSRFDIANLVAQWVIEFADIPDIHENPISKAIVEGDGISLLAFMHTLKLKGYDLDQILGPQGVLRRGVSSPLNWSVLHGTLSARSTEAFTMLLPRFRHLIEVPSDAGLTALATASADGNVEAVRSLLEYNANVLHCAKNGANALVLALTHNHRSIAELLLRKCEVSTALGPNPHGVTAFGQVLRTYLSGRRQIQISTFDFFRQHNALSFTPNGRDNVWRFFFTKDRATLDEHRAADLRLFRYFLRDDVFGRHINDLDWTGRTALHYAAYYNHFEALEMLLDHHASVNIENLTADESGQLHNGKTAADFALYARESGPPKHVLAGGAYEVREWQNRNEAMLKLLVDQGAESGSGRNGFNTMQIAMIKEPQAFKVVHMQDMASKSPFYYSISLLPRLNETIGPPRGDLTWRGKWPKRIPNCPSKWSHSPNQSKPWRDDDSDDPQKPDSQTQISQRGPILYRTPGGKRMRISPHPFALIGAIMDDAQGPTYSEEDKQGGYDLLQKAQTFIAARRAEQEGTQVTNRPQPQMVFTPTNVEKN